MDSLLKAKERGETPQALLDKPELPWYYEDFIEHFAVLSFSRSSRPEVQVTSEGGKLYTSAPQPIDIPSIIQYNEAVVKMDSCAEFISIIQCLDSVFLTHRNKPRGL